MNKTYVNKSLAVAVILLFIGVAFAPSINANISKLSADPIPDLDCEGDLCWTDAEPGVTATGTFVVGNMGDTESELDWEIESYPEWGTWAFTPDSGEDLTPEDGAVTVTVFVDAPDEPETEFFGEVRIVNTENSDDYYVIPVYLRTPVSQDSIDSQSMLLQRLIMRIMC